jgi:hypothetical protein
LYVNGILTDLERHFGDMQALANSGAAVIGLHDSTEKAHGDVLQFFSDRYKLSESGTIQSLLSVLRNSVKSNTALHLAGHSRGAQKIGLALLALEEELLTEQSKEAVQTALAHLQIETYGGAAPRYPDGPQYVHMNNFFDPVSKVYGLLSSFGLSRGAAYPGKGAVNITLRTINLELETILNKGDTDAGMSIIDRMVHNPRSIYFSRRLPFAQSRERGSFELGD